MRSADEILRDELDLEADRNWEKEYQEYEDILEFYTPDEKAVLQKNYYGKNVYGEAVPREDEDEFDMNAFKGFVRAAIETDIGEACYRPMAPSNLYSYASPVNYGKEIKITKYAFKAIRHIAKEANLFYGAESAGFLYGKNDVIKKVRRYNCKQSSALVTGNAIDVFKQYKKSKFMGMFHSHLFNSSSMSGTDREVLMGWTDYANRFGKQLPVMIIARSPDWRQKCWSMDEKFNIMENILTVV